MAFTAAATTLLIQACGGSAQAQSATDADVIEGVWQSDVMLKDCSSGAPIVAFKAATLMARGGALNADDSFSPPSRGATFGNWKHGSGQAYTSNLRFMRFNADGSLAGSQKVSRNFTLDADNNKLSGSVKTQVIDLSGAVLQEVCGSETGTRVY